MADYHPQDAISGVEREAQNRSWEIVQEKAFTQWVNSVLQHRDMKIEDLIKDLGDGIILINFLELISNLKLGRRWDPNPRGMRIKIINNCALAVKFIETKLKVELWDLIQAEDIVDGNKKLILGLFWTLFRKFKIQVISEGNKSSEEGLLLWIRNQIGDYPGVNISSFQHSFRDGLAFLALVHKAHPELFDYTAFSKDDPENNLNVAWNHANDTMMIPRILDVNEVMSGQADERSLVLYLSLYFHEYKAAEERSRLLQEKREMEAAMARQLLEKDDLMASERAQLEATAMAANATREDLAKEVVDLRQKVKDLEKELEDSQKKQHIIMAKLEVKQENNELEEKGFQLLKKNLDDHLDDMNQWRKYLDPYIMANTTDFFTDQKPQIDQELMEQGCQEQLANLTERLINENDFMIKVLNEKKKVARPTKKKSSEKRKKKQEKE